MKLTSNVSNITTTAAMPRKKNRLFSRCLVQAIGYFLAEVLVAAIDIKIEQSHAHNLPEEIHDGNVEQTEQEKPEGAEIEGQQSVPENDGQRLVVDTVPAESSGSSIT